MSYKTSLLNISENPRITEIDVAKGIGILLVVFAHVNYTSFLLEYIYSFHMPLFFVLSGFVFDRKRYLSFADFLRRRVKNLICPYIFFAVMSVLFECIIIIYGNGFSVDLVKTFCKGIINILLSRGSADFFNAPLWFVLCLFTVEIIYFFVSKLKDKFAVLICMALVVLGWFLESEYFTLFENKLLPWSIDSALFALGFYALGNFVFQKSKLHIFLLSDHKNKNLIIVGIIILSIAIGFPLALVNGKVSLGSKILNNGFVFYATGIIGTVLVVAVSALLKKSKFLAWCGQNSFYIMAVHYICRVSLRYIYKFFDIPIYDKTSLKETILPYIIVLFFSILFAYCYGKLKKFCFNLRQKADTDIC